MLHGDPEGGSTENNDRKVGPREREYTRTMPLPSPDWSRCLSQLLFHQRSVDLRHGNENEHLHPAAGAARWHPEPLAIVRETRTRHEVSVNEHHG